MTAVLPRESFLNFQRQSPTSILVFKVRKSISLTEGISTIGRGTVSPKILSPFRRRSSLLLNAFDNIQEYLLFQLRILHRTFQRSTEMSLDDQFERTSVSA